MLWLVTKLELEYVPQHVKITALSASTSVVHLIWNLVPASFMHETVLITRDPG